MADARQATLGKVVKDQPYSAFRFLVKMGSEVEASCAFTNFSGIKMETQLVRARVGDDIRGVKDNYPGITEFQNVTLKKGVIEKNSFLSWIFEATFPGNDAGPLCVNMYRDLTIVSLTQDGREGVKWELLNAIPVSYELQPMDASQSGILCETLEFAICGVKRDISKDKDGAEVYNQDLVSTGLLGKSTEEVSDMQKEVERYNAKLKAAGKTVEQLMESQKTANSFDGRTDEEESKHRAALQEQRKKQKAENAEKLSKERAKNAGKVKQLMKEQGTSNEVDEKRAEEKAKKKAQEKQQSESAGESDNAEASDGADNAEGTE